MQREVVHVLRKPVGEQGRRHLGPVVLDVVGRLVASAIHYLPGVRAQPRHGHAYVLGDPMHTSGESSRRSKSSFVKHRLAAEGVVREVSDNGRPKMHIPKAA